MRIKILLVSIFSIFLLHHHYCHSQSNNFPVNEWIKKLSVKHDGDNKNFSELLVTLSQMDSAAVSQILIELEKKGSSNSYFRTRFLCLKAQMSHHFSFSDKKTPIKKIFEEALHEAYKTADDDLILLVCQNYGVLISVYDEIELAATYLLKADEILEQRGYTSKNLEGQWFMLGEILFRARDYEKSIYYIKKGLDYWKDTSANANYYRIRYLNAIGQSYQRLGSLDSAMDFYERSMRFSLLVDDNDVWRAINSGFMGQVLFLKKEYKKAKALLEYDFSVNKNYEWNIAANSLQWLAKISLTEGKKDSALIKIKEARNFLPRPYVFSIQQANYLQDIFFTTAEVYRALNQTDSFYYYFQQYSALRDSLERLAATSSVKMARIRIEKEKNYQKILLLQQEKQAEVLKRNFILIVITLLSVIVFLYVNRLRLKHRHKEQMAIQQKSAAEAEMNSAKEQLKLFTQNIIEKSNLIENLEARLHSKALSAEQQDLISNLTSQTILTEADWEKFKSLFEKLYPGFFIKLKQKAPDITLAEQRMAALTRLHLTTKQMASMLGISVDSVHKSRQRLRQRLQIDPESNLEQKIANL